MFEITKEQNVVIVTATVSPRRFSKEKKIFIHWEDAYREAKNRYPEIEINKTPDNYVIVSNTQQNSGTWRFKINKKEQKNPPEEKRILTEKTTSKKRSRKNKSFKDLVKSSEKSLTPTEEPVTVEETSQSDQPAIVQEPTE